MPKINLIDKHLRRQAPASGQIELWDQYVPGFGLRISAGGSRTYFVMKRLDGRLVRRTVGKAPAESAQPGTKQPSGVYWVTEARQRARDILIDLGAGIDPGPQKTSKSVADAGPAKGTFKAVADDYLRDALKGGGASLRSRAELERKLKVDLESWHTRPIVGITAREVDDLIRQKAKGSPISANRLLSFIKRVFRWAVRRHYIGADPAAAVDKPGEESIRSRYLDEREVKLFWKACDKLGEPAGRLFQLALVTAQRRGEVAGLLRSEIGRLDYKVIDPTTNKQKVMTGAAWLLPAARTKRNVDHAVPLSPLALKLIDEAPMLSEKGRAYDHAFASGARGDQPISGWSRYKARLDELIGREIASEAQEEYCPDRHVLPAWHFHDLRATSATFLVDRLEVRQQVVSRILNHAEGDGRSMTARYVRATFDKEAADALDRWAEMIAQIVGLNVVEMNGKRV